MLALLHASFSADMTARTIDGSASVMKLAPPHWAKEPSTLTSSASEIIDQGTASPKAYAARAPHVFCSDPITQRALRHKPAANTRPRREKDSCVFSIRRYKGG